MSETIFRFWDVKHEHSTYVQSPNDRHVAIDLGTGSHGEFNYEHFSPINHLNKKYNVKRLDYLIITHPHRDHINDILNIDKVRPRVLNRPSHLAKSDIIPDDVGSINEKNIENI